MMIKIRYAKSSDVQQIYELILSIADHHGQSKSVETNTRELLAAGFCENPKFGILLAELNGAVVGFVSFSIHYSIWRGQDYLNIDDVYVSQSSRGLGIGEKLMQESRNHCAGIGVSRIRWEVEADNRNAIRFYQRLGAQVTEKGIFSWDIPR
jgi:ribosomal protein S18 acetylase RimI-like enzyme